MVYVNGEYVSTGLTLTDNVWNFICIVWRSQEGYYEIYVDGNLQLFGRNLNQGGLIEAHGNLMIGQEQVRRQENIINRGEDKK